MTLAVPWIDWLFIVMAYAGLTGLALVFLYSASERRRPVPRRWIDDREQR